MQGRLIHAWDMLISFTSNHSSTFPSHYHFAIKYLFQPGRASNCIFSWFYLRYNRYSTVAKPIEITFSAIWSKINFFARVYYSSCMQFHLLQIIFVNAPLKMLYLQRGSQIFLNNSNLPVHYFCMDSLSPWN